MSQDTIWEILPQTMWLVECTVLPGWGEPTESVLLSFRGVVLAANGDNLALAMIWFVCVMSFA